MTTASIAANAYAAAARAALGAPAKPPQTAETQAGFGAMLEKSLTQAAESGRMADQQTQAFATGRVDLVDVVTAVAETEVAIETLVSVRDRVIQAYEEIMRMPI